MIRMSNILRIGSISAHVNNVLLRKKRKKNSSPSYLSRHDKVMMRKGTGNKYELPCCGSHKILKVITNGTVRLRSGFLTDTINIVKYEMPYNGSHKILKSLRMELYVFVLASLLIR
jgi:hypothetical protein